MSELKVNKISPRSGTDITLGDSGDTFTLGSGANIAGLTLSDNILFDTASKGIYLGVTTATASNLLDDYEEGTWTPEFGGTTTDPSAVYNTANSFTSGGYVKIGRQVTIVGQIRLTSGTTGGTGTLTIKNLPFSTSLTNSGRGYVGNVTINNIALPTDTVYIKLSSDPVSQSTFFEFIATRDDTTLVGVDAADLATNQRVYFTATYFTT